MEQTGFIKYGAPSKIEEFTPEEDSSDNLDFSSAKMVICDSCNKFIVNTKKILNNKCPLCNSDVRR